MRKVFNIERPLVCIQGMGFVGSAMAIAVASAEDERGNPIYNVVGIDLNDKSGIEKTDSINNGHFPFQNVDLKLQQVLNKCIKQNNLYASTDFEWLGKASIVLSDINLDVFYKEDGTPYLNMAAYEKSIEIIGKYIKLGTLVIVETTVPPGTCQNIVKPIIRREFAKRGIDKESVLLAHSYERVMPGANYYDSIVHYWRVYSGINEESANRCEVFLRNVINYKKYPLTRLSCTTASETSKVLENSYRATTIAFMEEWGRFAEAAGFDLFEVVDAIRMRPTHSNMRQPGFGVGGYCLTKDPYFAMLGAKDILKIENLEFPFCTAAVKLNNKMPIVSLDKIQKMLAGNIKGKKILVLGVSYRQEVGDTRYSPTEIFAKEAIKRGAVLDYHDPIVGYWEEMGVNVLKDLPSPDGYDVLIFTVAHKEYTVLDMQKWLGNAQLAVFDANKVLSSEQINSLGKTKCHFASIGRG